MCARIEGVRWKSRLPSIEYVCLRWWVGVTVNDNVLLGFSCPLLSYFVMSLHTDRVRFLCVRVEREREGERHRARAESGEQAKAK